VGLGGAVVVVEVGGAADLVYPRRVAPVPALGRVVRPQVVDDGLVLCVVL